VLAARSFKEIFNIYFLFQFANLYYHFEIYQNYTPTAVGHGGSVVTAVMYSG
jgi:hypothetical protein